MARQKRMLNITMLEGVAYGSLQCNLKPGQANVYKISRDSLSEYKKLEDLSKPESIFSVGE